MSSATKTLIVGGAVMEDGEFERAAVELRRHGVELVLAGTLKEAQTMRLKMLEREDFAGEVLVVAAHELARGRKLSDPVAPTPEPPGDDAFYLARAQERRDQREARRAEQARRTAAGKALARL